MAVSHIFSSPVPDFTGTVTVFNSAGATETRNATEIVRPSNWNSVHNQFVTLTGNTNNASTGSGTNLILSGGNGVTLIGSNDSIGFSVATNYQSQGAYLTTAALSNHSHGNPQLNLTNLSGTTNSNSAGFTLSLSAHNQAFSAQGGSSTFETLSFNNANGASFSNVGGAVQLSYTVPAPQTGISGIEVSNTTYTSGTVTFRNANGISFGSSGANGISASYTVPTQSAQTVGVYASSNTTGQSSSSTVDARSLSFRGMGVASVGLSAGEVIISVPAGGGGGFSAGMSTEGNTAGTTSIVSNRLVFVGSGPISLSQSANGASATLTILGPATSSLAATGALSASSNGNTISLGVGTVTAYATSNTTQASSGTIDLNSILFQARGGVSVGISNGSIVVSGGAGAAQTGISGIEVSNTTYTSGTVTFRNANGISFGSSGANGISASYTVPTQTNQTGAIYAVGNTTGESSSSTYDARTLSIHGTGLSIGWSAGSLRLSVTQSNQAASASNGSFTFQTLNFSNANNVTFGSSAGGIITASVAAAGAVTLSAYAQSNTTQSSSGTLAGSSLMFAGAGIASVGVSNGSVIVSVPSGGGAGDGGVFAGVSNLGNTAGSTGTVSTGNLVLVGSGPISLSQSTGAAGSAATVTINGPATSSLVGASGISISTNGSTISVYAAHGSFFANMPYILNSQTQTVGQSTSVAFPFDQKEVEDIGFLRVPHTISLASTSFASTANTSYSYNQAETHNIVLYTRGTGASSMSLQSISSTSASVQMSIRLSRNTTNNISVTHAFTFPVSNGTSSLSFSFAATNSSDQFSTTHLTNISGMKMWDTQFAATLLGGIYWMVYGVSTTQTTQGTANLSAARLLHSHVALSQPNNTIGLFGLANNASNQWREGIGSFTTAGGGTTASIPLSAISSSSSHNVPQIQMLRIA